MPSGELPFLTPEAVAESCRLAGFEAEAIPYLKSAARWIAADADLVRLAWHCHHLLCHSPSYSRGDARHWTPLAGVLGEWAGAFYLLIALSGVPQVRVLHQSRGIPDGVARDTYGDTSLWAREYQAKHGVWGLEPYILPWLFNHLSGELYRLGRLQFIQRPLRQKLLAFRNRVTRDVQVLAEAGVRYRVDGQLEGTGGVSDPETGWTSRLLMDSTQVVGTPIHPTGVVLREEVCLPWIPGNAFWHRAIQFWRFIFRRGVAWTLMPAAIRCTKRLISSRAISPIDRFRGSAVLRGY